MLLESWGSVLCANKDWVNISNINVEIHITFLSFIFCPQGGALHYWLSHILSELCNNSHEWTMNLLANFWIAHFSMAQIDLSFFSNIYYSPWIYECVWVWSCLMANSGWHTFLISTGWWKSLSNLTFSNFNCSFLQTSLFLVITTMVGR
jgi:uncharacterized membrane protein